MLFILVFSHCKAVAINYQFGGTVLNFTSFFSTPTLGLPDFNQLFLHIASNAIINNIFNVID